MPHLQLIINNSQDSAINKLKLFSTESGYTASGDVLQINIKITLVLYSRLNAITI